MNKIKRYSIHLISFQIILLSGLASLPSCTYDYFEDETNYVVYAPKAHSELITDDYRIEDIHIYIYNSETLHKHKKAAFPFQESARMKQGNFNFRVFPGSYSVFCFANTDGMNYSEMSPWQDAAFGLPELDNGEYHYPASFSSLSVELLNPDIIFPGPVITDTAHFHKRYSGRICVAFKELTNINPLLTYNNIGNIVIKATGTGTHQPMSLLTDSIHTRSNCYTDSDQVTMDCPLYENPIANYSLGTDGYFFPSVSDGRPITLTIDFIDKNGVSIHEFPINVTETLHMNQTIYLGTDGLSVVILDITAPEQWNSEIISDDDQPGSGGGMDI